MAQTRLEIEEEDTKTSALLEIASRHKKRDAIVLRFEIADDSPLPACASDLQFAFSMQEDSQGRVRVSAVACLSRRGEVRINTNILQPEMFYIILALSLPLS